MQPHADYRSYAFVSHRVELPAGLAAIAYDFALSHLPSTGSLVLAGPPARRPERRGYLPVRRAVGTLYLARRSRPRVAVALEVLPLSDRASELAITPVGRPNWLAGERRVRKYTQSANSILAMIATLMMAPRPDWLESLLVGDPSSVTLPDSQDLPSR